MRSGDTLDNAWLAIVWVDCYLKSTIMALILLYLTSVFYSGVCINYCFCILLLDSIHQLYTQSQAKGMRLPTRNVILRFEACFEELF